MINTFILIAMISIEEPKAIIPAPDKIEAGRKRGKGHRGHRKGGSRLR